MKTALQTIALLFLLTCVTFGQILPGPGFVTKPTVSGSGDPDWASVSLLMKVSGSTVTDAKGKTVTLSGNATGGGTVQKFSTNTLLLDGSGDYATVPTSTDFDFGTGDYTVETWFYSAVTIPTGSYLNDRFFVSASGAGGMFFGVYTSTSGQLKIGIGRAGIAWDNLVDVSISASTWYHIMVRRSGSTVRFYLNGTQAGSDFTNTNSYNLSTTSLTIGSQGTTYYWNGNLFDLRVTKGVARTPATPTAPFPTN